MKRVSASTSVFQFFCSFAEVWPCPCPEPTGATAAEQEPSRRRGQAGSSAGLQPLWAAGGFAQVPELLRAGRA